jgi:hypothetical protein
VIARHRQGERPFTIDLWTFPHPGERRVELPLAELLARYVRRRDVTIVRSPSGKPGLAAERVHFSGAHAIGLSVVAVASRPVGVDLESLDAPPRAIEGVRRYLPEWERGWIAQAKEDARLERLLICWTRLEALCKAQGTGLRGPIRAGWGSAHFRMAGNGIGAVAARGTQLRLRLRNWRR